MRSLDAQNTKSTLNKQKELAYPGLGLQHTPYYQADLSKHYFPPF